MSPPKAVITSTKKKAHKHRSFWPVKARVGGGVSRLGDNGINGIKNFKLQCYSKEWSPRNMNHSLGPGYLAGVWVTWVAGSGSCGPYLQPLHTLTGFPPGISAADGLEPRE